ncbi:unnamed protein product, partial [Heterotrigona itama]
MVRHKKTLNVCTILYLVCLYHHCTVLPSKRNWRMNIATLDAANGKKRKCLKEAFRVCGLADRSTGKAGSTGSHGGSNVTLRSR